VANNGRGEASLLGADKGDVVAESCGNSMLVSKRSLHERRGGLKRRSARTGGPWKKPTRTYGGASEGKSGERLGGCLHREGG